MDWWRGAVFYQVYPLSFQDSDGNGTGDLKGVLDRLDHIAGLGVDAVWLSPVFPSPMRDFGYDVSDYCGVGPLFGSLADFDALVAAAHARGLKLIIDQVWSHTADAHPWFAESAAGRNGPKADWYVWADPAPGGGPPNNWLSVFGGSAWTWSPGRGQFYLHNFLAEQPDLNFHNPQVRAAVLDAARFWLERGVDGFRLDVVNYYVHDARLRDNPPSGRTGLADPYRTQRHIYDCSRPETLDFVAELRRLLDSYGAVGLGEIFDDQPLARQIQYTDGLHRLHTAYSFFLLDARRAEPALFAEAMDSWTGAAGWPAWSLSNHDVTRFPTRFGADTPHRVKQLLALLLCLRGSPILYQGDELGLPHAEVPYDRLRDPFAIALYAGQSGRDGARTPMAWSRTAANGGFSTADTTWLPFDPRHAALAADVQDADPASVLNFVRAFLALRRAQPALIEGASEIIPSTDGLLAFERRRKGSRLLCLFELAGRPAVHPVEGGRLLPSGLGGELVSGEARLPPYGAALIAID